MCASRKLLLLLTLASWATIVAVTVFDVVFAVNNRETMSEWEMNPFARMVLAKWGIAVLVGIRVGTIVTGMFAMLVSTPRFRWIQTAVVLVAHLYLARCYLELA